MDFFRWLNVSIRLHAAERFHCIALQQFPDPCEADFVLNSVLFIRLVKYLPFRARATMSCDWIQSCRTQFRLCATKCLVWANVIDEQQIWLRHNYGRIRRNWYIDDIPGDERSSPWSFKELETISRSSLRRSACKCFFSLVDTVSMAVLSLRGKDHSSSDPPRAPN